MRGWSRHSIGNRWPARPLVDPGAEQTDFRRGEFRTFARGRHEMIGIETGDELNQPAIGALARQDHGSTVSARERLSPAMQGEARRLFVGTMA